MSTIPSLALIPSGYKASKVYSVLPTDGSGDLTFTRALDTATRVRPDGLIEGVGANVPRLDYLGGGCPKLLLEPQRTNLVLFSEQIDNAAWNKGRTTATANTTISPSGFQDADTLTDQIATSGTHRVISNIFSVTSGTTFASSFFVKAGTSSRVEICLKSSVEALIGITPTIFDLSNGTIVSGSGSIENYGNGWFRCTNIGTTNTTTNASVFTFVYNTANQRSYNATGTNTLFLYGCQTEAGAYATSYIPTVAAAVTRSADVASKTGISALIGQTEGTIFVEGTFANTQIGQVFMELFGTAPNVNLQLGTGSLFFFSTGQWSINTAVSPNVSYKIAAAYKQNDIVLFVNGVLIGTDTNASITAKTSLFVNTRNIGDFHTDMRAAQVLLFKTRLTNAQLAELTA